MILDTHIHTYFSYDSSMKPNKILKLAKKKGLNGIIVCDHNTIKGGVETKKLNKDKSFNVIVGAEILTDAGDITGIFLANEIKSREVNSVLDEIKAQKGLTILNHPFKHHNLDKIDFKKIDFIEGYNGRLNKDLNDKAIELAKKYNKPILAGSDSHIYNEIGNCKTFFEKENLLNPINWEYKQTPYYNIAKSQYIKAIKTKKFKLLIITSIILIKSILKSVKIFKK